MTVRAKIPGVYDMKAEAYHADPCPRPSLSRSVGQILLAHTPRHAWEAHPRLNPNYKPKRATKGMDLGTVAHAILLGDSMDRFRVVKSPDYKGYAAQRARDLARAGGLTPILEPELERAQAMAAAARPQLEAHEDGRLAFVKGKPEQTLIWRERIAPRVIVWCRVRVDWLPDDPTVPWYDYKSTATSAEPGAFGRFLFNEDYDFQAGFYRRAAVKVLGWQPPKFFFIAQEVEPPFALSVNGLTPRAHELADAMAETAVQLWGECQRQKCWPGYPTKTAYHEPPTWKEQRWAERIAHDSLHAGKSLKERMIAWQAPHERKRA
jgi:hypothetical protein